MANKNPRIPQTVSRHLAFESPKGLPEVQTGRLALALGREFPVTSNYVNLRTISRFVQKFLDLSPEGLLDRREGGEVPQAFGRARSPQCSL